jgi:hypothetical protein
VVIRTLTRFSISAVPQPDLRSIRASSYSLPNRYSAPSTSVAHLLIAENPGELLREVGGERDPGLAALPGVRHHRAGIAGPDQDQVDAAVVGRQRATSISPSSLIAPA